MGAELSAIRKDPACKSLPEAFLYPGLYAIVIHIFLIHSLYIRRWYFMARLFSQIMRFFTGVEIHPGAVLGRGIFIDHAIAIVVGETCEIGNNCILYHNITLGGTGNHEGKRHPTVGDNCQIGTGSILLGPITIGNNTKIGANCFIINKDTPSDCTVVDCPGRIVRLNGRKVDLPLQTCEREKERRGTL